MEEKPNKPVYVSKYPDYVKPPRKPRQPWMCSAHLTDGSGDLCQKPALGGASVCLTHGASAPQVKAAAKRRFEEMVPQAQDAIQQLLKGDHPPAKLGAAREVFDRSLGAVHQGAPPQVGVIVQFGDSMRGVFSVVEEPVVPKVIEAASARRIEESSEDDIT